MKRPFESEAVADAFDGYPSKIRRKLLALRELIFKTAASTEGVGRLTETLKWGEPAYLTAETRSGTTVRIGWKKSKPSQYAVYFHCQTNLVAGFRRRLPGQFSYEGSRAIVFDEGDKVPTEPLSGCIAAALTYHRSKKEGRRK